MTDDERIMFDHILEYIVLYRQYEKKENDLGAYVVYQYAAALNMALTKIASNRTAQFLLERPE